MFASASSGFAQAVITETFQNTGTPSNWLFGRSSATGTSNFVPTSGVAIGSTGTSGLQLSNNTNNTATSARYTQTFNASGASVYAEFSYQMYGGTNGTTGGHGGDGLTFFLYDGSYVSSFQTGAYGGSLGYAQKTGISGMTGGYIGVGLDAYGNFAAASEGRVGGYNGTTSAVTESISVRGPASGGYAYLGGTSAHLGTGDPNVNVDSGGSPTPTANTVQVLLTATNQLTVTLAQGGSTPQTVLQMDLSGYTRPDLLSFGFTAGSGDATNYVFVNGLSVTTVEASKWANSTGNGNWGLNTNWNPSVVPTTGFDVLFDNSSVNSSQIINTGENRSLRSITFDAPFDYTVNGNTITLNSNGVAGFTGIAVTQTHGTGTHTINSNLALATDIKVRNNASGTLILGGGIATGSGSSAKTITFDGTGADTRVTGAISGSGSVIKNDTGTVTLSAANNYSGGTTLNNGTLNANSSTALGSGGVTLSGGTLASTNNSTINNALTLSGNATLSGITTSGALTQSGANRTLTLDNATQSGNVLLSNNGTGRTLTVEVNAGTSTISGAITNGGTGTGSVTKTGSGTLVVSGQNTYTGTTTISDGTLQLGGNDRLTSTGAVSIGASGTLNLNGFSQRVGTLTATGGATIDFGATGTANNFLMSSYVAPTSGVLVINNWENGVDKLGATSITAAAAGTIFISGYGTAAITGTGSIGSYSGTHSIIGVGIQDQFVWNGSSSSVWETGSNWNRGARPTAGDIAIFNATGAARTTVNIDNRRESDRTVSGLRFDSNAPAYTIQGTRALILSGTVPYIQQKSAANQTVSADLLLNGNTVMDITSSGNLTLSGDISGAYNMIKDGTGSGRLILSGANSALTGNVHINNGIVQARTATALGSATSRTYIAQGATLELSATGNITNAIDFTGAGSGGNGAIRAVAGTSGLTGTLTQTGSATIAADAGTVLNIGGNLTGANVSTTFAGAGNISIDEISTTGSSDVTMNGTGTLRYYGTTANTYAGDTTVNSGTLALAKTANTNSIAANLLINGGTVRLDASNQIANLSRVTLNGSGTLDINGQTETIGQLNSSSATSAVKLGTGSLTVNAVNNQNSTFEGELSGSGSINVAGTGKLYLSGNNTGFTGTANVNGGTLNASGSNSVLGTAAVNVAVGGNLQLQGGITLNNAITIRGTGTSENGAIENFAGSNTLSGSITVASSSRIQSNSGTLAITGSTNLGSNSLTIGGSGNTNISGLIGGTGGLVKEDSGTLTLTGNSTFTGATSVSGGSLVLGGNSTISESASLTISSTANVTLAGGVSQTVAGLTAGGSTTIALGANSVLTIDGTGSSSILGSLTGSGSLVIGGGGSVALGDNLAFGGTVNIGGSSTLSLLGDVNLGTLHITGNTVLDFGNSASTTLNVSNLIIDAGATVTVINWVNMTDFFYAQDFAGAVPDQRGNSPITNNTSTQIVFSGWNSNNTAWQGYDHQITPAPEPATYGAILMGGMLGLVGFRRWRKGSRNRHGAR